MSLKKELRQSLVNSETVIEYDSCIRGGIEITRCKHSGQILNRRIIR